jgi:hypothetical protein
MFSKKTLLAAAASVLFSVPTLVSATPISYYGAILDLSIVDIGAAGGTYRVTYTADFTGYTNSAAQPYIDSISWKHAGANVSTVSLVSDPGLGWMAYADSAVNANGCSGTGGNTWACAEDLIPFYASTSGILTWVFDATFSGGALATLNTTGDSIKARFVDFWGSKEGALLSCTLDANTQDNCSGGTTTRIPEPSTTALLGLGILSIGVVLRRRTAVRARR